MNTLILLLAVSANPPQDIVGDRVDIIEVNYFYDDQAELALTQLVFWEFNLRFKTDGSERGPLRGKPVLVSAGMVGDRAQAVFSAPDEISAFIERNCTPS